MLREICQRAATARAHRRARTAATEENLKEAELIYRRLFSPSYLALGDNLRLQAQALLLGKKHPEAESKINEALQIYRAGTSDQYINYPTALIVQGSIWAQTGRTAEAERLLREAVQLRSQYTPETHFLRAIANGVLGDFLTGQKRFADAEPLLINSFEILEQSQAANSPRTRTALQRLVALYENWGRSEAAKNYRSKLVAR